MRNDAWLKELNLRVKPAFICFVVFLLWAFVSLWSNCDTYDE